MPVWLAEWVVALLGGYAVVGLAVGLAFLSRGVEKLDPRAIGAHAFRPLLLPGLVLLWPLVLRRWAGTPPRAAPPDLRRRQDHRHRRGWRLLAVALPGLLLLGIGVRLTNPPATAPQFLGVAR